MPTGNIKLSSVNDLIKQTRSFGAGLFVIG